MNLVFNSKQQDRMPNKGKSITILMADDDSEDCLLTKQMFEDSRFANDLRFVENGEELLKYLRHEDRFKNEEEYPSPSLILLDLNMPRKDGRTALKEIKADPVLRQIPVIVLTTSNADEDISSSYESEVNSYIVKPIGFETMVDVLLTFEKYWFQIVELSPEDSSAS